MPPYNRLTFSGPMHLEAASAPARRYRGGEAFAPIGLAVPASYKPRYGRRLPEAATPASTVCRPATTTAVDGTPAAPEFALAA